METDGRRELKELFGRRGKCGRRDLRELSGRRKKEWGQGRLM
jgi:hypothetical protein